MQRKLPIITTVMSSEFFNLFHTLQKEIQATDSVSIINYSIQKISEKVLGIETIFQTIGLE
jgi:hypothetical protein